MARKKKIVEETIEEIAPVEAETTVETPVELVEEPVVEEAQLIEEVTMLVTEDDKVELIEEEKEMEQTPVKVEKKNVVITPLREPKVYNEVDPGFAPYTPEEKVYGTTKAPEAPNKEYFDGGLQGDKAVKGAMSTQEINAAVVKAELKVAGSLDEVKDQTYVDTSVGGLVRTHNEHERNDTVFHRD